jgi:surface antigen
MRAPLSLFAVFCCAACAVQPDPDASQAVVQAQGQNPPVVTCREFTAPVTVGGQPQQASGQACQQPDGSWRITQNTPSLPTLEYTVPPPPAYPYAYPDYWTDSWDYGPPLFVGGSIFFANGFHHFHHNGGFRHGGFHGGVHHGGFHGGFHGGMHH